MKGISLKHTVQTEQKSAASLDFMKNYVLYPLRSGLFGFSTFFAVLIFTKLLSYWIGTYEEFVVDLDDVFLSSIGFVLVFLIKFLENFKEKEA
ncbi:MAG: hypothetical protein KJ799_05620 [Bacteroidetes bacterium]|nr:hypothetical protein [Bacteroidota bacterium]MBU1679102.1 hypothetical protein [Bacteroidota bacterium]MBU2506186.1 hypothetical protein [Bacteroidota bacterium]